MSDRPRAILPELHGGLEGAPRLTLIERRLHLVPAERVVELAEQGDLVVVGSFDADQVLDAQLARGVLRVRENVELDGWRGRRLELDVVERR